MIFRVFLILLFSSILFAEDGFNSREERLTYELAESLYKEGRYAESRELFSDFTELYYSSPKRFDASERVAQVELRDQDYVEALAIYTSLVSDSPYQKERLRYLFEKGKLEKKMGLYDAAIASWSRIISEDVESLYAKEAQMQIDALQILR